jgi:hypothetical protein
MPTVLRSSVLPLPGSPQDQINHNVHVFFVKEMDKKTKRKEKEQ